MRSSLILALSLCLLTTPVAAQPPSSAPAAQASTAPVEAPALSEVLSLRVEVHRLRLSVAERDTALAQATKALQEVALGRERSTLDADIATAHAGWQMDWQSGRLVPRPVSHDTTTPKP